MELNYTKTPTIMVSLMMNQIEKGEESWFIRMEDHMKENGLIIKNTETVLNNSQMEINIQESFYLESQMDLEYLNGMMEKGMKVNSKMEKSTDKECGQDMDKLDLMNVI